MVCRNRQLLGGDKAQVMASGPSKQFPVFSCSLAHNKYGRPAMCLSRLFNSLKDIVRQRLGADKDEG
jgi:hypothetical protein